MVTVDLTEFKVHVDPGLMVLLEQFLDLSSELFEWKMLNAPYLTLNYMPHEAMTKKNKQISSSNTTQSLTALI